MHIISLGPKGTYSDLVARKFQYQKISYVQDITEISPFVLQGTAYRGVIPVENSTTGLILIGIDSITAYKELTIVAEVEIPIKFHLVSHCELAKIKTLYVQNEAFYQCSRFIQKKIPQVQVIFCRSNIETIKHFEKVKEKNHAAIIPSYIAKEERIKKYFQFASLANHKNNTTRFFIIKKESKNLQTFQLDSKVSIYFEFQEDKPSLLYQILKVFHQYKINLTMLSSRALPHRKWSYGFFVDFQIIHKNDISNATKVLKKINDFGACLNILGIYKNISKMKNTELEKI